MTSTHDTIPAGDLAADDPRATFATAVRTSGELIRSVSPAELDQPTPCTEFDVRALIGHMTIVLRRIAALGNGDDPMSVAPVTGVADDGWYAAWHAEAHEVQRAWSDPGTLERTMVLPWVSAPGAAMLANYTAELTVHTWDLGTAVGRLPEFDPAVVEVSMDAALRALPPGDREATFPQRFVEIGLPADTPLPFRNAVTVADGASALDRLVAWYGRQPSSR